MEPIIAPSFFYWIDVLDTIRIIFFLLGGIGIICFGISVPAYFAETITKSDIRENTADYRFFKKLCLCLILSIFVLVSGIFVPAKPTLIKMKIAEYVTKDNVQKVVKYISDIKEETKADVIDIIKELKKEE
jgi:hypothetical protein